MTWSRRGIHWYITVSHSNAMASESQCTFLRLPAELRERIYRLCFGNHHEVELSRPWEPPLSQVSWLVREESLPIYYSAFTLGLRTLVKCDFYGNAWLRTGDNWYHKLHADKLKWIEHFKLRFGLVQQYTGEVVPVEFRLSLSKRAGCTVSRHSFDTDWLRHPHRTGDPADFEEIVQVLRRHLNETLEALGMSPGIGNLSAADIDQMARVDPDSLPLQTSG